MEARYEKTSHENKDYNNEITNLKKQISNLEKENKILDTGNANYEKTIKQLQQQIDNLNTSIDRLESENTRQKKEITTSRNDYKHSVEVSNKLQRDLNGLHDEKNKFMFSCRSNTEYVSNGSYAEKNILKRYEIKSI